MSGLVVGIAGVVSGIFVIAANSWMNSPAGFDWVNGQAINIDPVKAMFNKAWFPEALHMTIAAFASTCFAVAGIHALMQLRHKGHEFHIRAVTHRPCFWYGGSPVAAYSAAICRLRI